MSASSPKHVVRTFVDCFNTPAAGNPWSLLAAEIVVTVNGTTPLSGRYSGIELVRGILVDTARNVISSLSVEIARMIGTGSTIATQLVIRGTTSDGRAINPEADACSCIFRVGNGVIGEIMLYPDTSAIEVVLYRRCFVPDRMRNVER